MAITTYPLNNITYDAEDAELFHCTRRSGVFMGSSGDTEYSDFDATVTGSNRVVTIQPGLAWIRNGRFKGKAVCVDASVSLTLTASNATYPRYDAIILRFNPSSNSSMIGSVQGTASSNPARPTPTRVENGIYDLHLYHVYRPAGSSVITSANVEDMRADLNYCGYMVDDVSAFDEGKFLAKNDYDPSNSVAEAGGIAQYVQTNAPKVTVSTSLTSTSTTTAASSSAVKAAYDRAGTAITNASSAQTTANSAKTLASNAIPASQKGKANGVASLGSDGKVPSNQLPDTSSFIFAACDIEEDESPNLSVYNLFYNKYNELGGLFFAGAIFVEDKKNLYYLSEASSDGSFFEFFNTSLKEEYSVVRVWNDGRIVYY